ncbi:MAG TPA: hypothetical protein VGM17_15060 [Rhizomicrobium sp.]|jgi:hypothetical protein
MHNKAARLSSLALVAVIAACSPSLIGGYRVVSTDGYNTMIVDKKSVVVVYPDVVSYGQRGRFIVGCRARSRYPISDRPEYVSGFGYFLLDTRNGKYTGGLASGAFRALAKRSGIETDTSGLLCH